MPIPRSLISLLFATVGASSLAFSQEKRPNILFIIADDQSPYDLKAYRPESKLDTPTLDKLAAEGVVLDQAYQMGSWSGAVCTPSRTMVMTGRSVWGIPGAEKYLEDKSLVPAAMAKHSMAAAFNRAGYDTMRTCKKGNSYAGANKEFTVVKDATKRGGTPETGSTWHGDQVMNYLEEREKSEDEDPFLIYYGFSHPHDVRDGFPDLLKKYGAVNHRDRETIPAANPLQPHLPLNYLPAHPFSHGHPGLRDEVKVPGVWERRDEQTIRNELGREFACSELIDQQIARVLEKLEAMGELDNTYIIYTADHGMAIGRHGLQGKQNLYEHTWRVPFIVKGPGIPAGKRLKGNTYLMDVLPTLCDLAGFAPPEGVNGKSMKPVLEGKQETLRDVLYGVYCGGTKPGMRSVRKGDWKLIQYDVLDGEVQEKQLFNLAENPLEYIAEHEKGGMKTNLAENPKFAEKQAEMEALLLAQMRENNDPYRLWDQPQEEISLPVKGKAKKGK
ncbi:MAG: sulfatase-like hydrolase/transferase [Roseibacillus sp.]